MKLLELDLRSFHTNGSRDQQGDQTSRRKLHHFSNSLPPLSVVAHWTKVEFNFTIRAQTAPAGALCAFWWVSIKVNVSAVVL